jgi:hypothetical protein
MKRDGTGAVSPMRRQLWWILMAAVAGFMAANLFGTEARCREARKIELLAREYYDR